MANLRYSIRSFLTRLSGPALAVGDQAVASIATLSATILVGRWWTRSAFGYFSLAFAIYILVLALYNALLLEPMTALTDTRVATRTRVFLRTHVQLHWLLSLSLAVLGGVASYAVILLGFREFGFAIAAAVGCAPFLLLGVFARRSMYLLRAPQRAAVVGVIHAMLMVMGLASLRGTGSTRSPIVPLVVMALSSSIAGSLLLSASKLRLASLDIGGVRAVARMHWNYGKWVATGAVLSAVSTPIQLFVVAERIGVSAVGSFRAMQVGMMAGSQLVAAVSLFELPRMRARFISADYEGMRRVARQVTFGLLGVVVGFELLLLVAHGMIEDVLYGGRYANDAWLLPLLGVTPIIQAATAGYSLILRVIDRPRHYLIVDLIWIPVTLVSTIALTNAAGLWGAGLSVSVAQLAPLVVNAILYKRWFVDANL